jgi:hypothetical protein
MSGWTLSASTGSTSTGGCTTSGEGVHPGQQQERLQVSGQVVNFLTQHLGFPIPSPAILEKIGLRFRKAVTEFARDNDLEVIRFTRGERKLEVMRPRLDRLTREGRTGVAAIGVAQEFQRVFTGQHLSPRRRWWRRWWGSPVRLRQGRPSG